MNGLRFPLISLFAFTALAAVSCAALVNPTEVWTIEIVTCVVASLFFGGLVAMHGEGTGRAFWQGYTLTGWSYLALVFVLNVADHFMETETNSYLATSRLVQWLCNARWPSPFVVSVTPVMPEAWWYTYVIGECLWAVVLGLIGGVIACNLY